MELSLCIQQIKQFVSTVLVCFSFFLLLIGSLKFSLKKNSVVNFFNRYNFFGLQ